MVKNLRGGLHDPIEKHFRCSGTSRRRVKRSVGTWSEAKPNEGLQLVRWAKAHTRNVASAATRREPQTKSSHVAQTICRSFARESDPEISAPLLAATERAIFERLLELSAAADASDETRDIRRAIDVMLKLKAKTSSQMSTGLSAGTHGIRV